jgi:hypothetical protein
MSQNEVVAAVSFSTKQPTFHGTILSVGSIILTLCCTNITLKLAGPTLG